MSEPIVKTQELEIMNFASRRKLAVVAGAMLAMVVTAFDSNAAGKVTISVWGGGYGEAWKKGVADPFTAQTGIEVVLDAGPSTQRLSKLLAARGGPDLFLITDHQMAVAHQRGLIDSVDPKKLSNRADLYDFAIDPLGAGCPATTLLGVGLAYNKAHLPSPPKSWKVLFDKDLRAAPAFMDMGFSVAPSVLIHLSELHGGSIDNVVPGLKAMADIKQRARFFSLFEVLDWINRGEVSVAPMLNTFVRKDPNVPLDFTFPDDGLIGVVNMACVVKGAANKENAERFLDYYLSPAVQAKSAELFGETPVNKKAKVPAGIRHTVVPAERISTMKFYDPAVIAKNMPKWLEMFQEIVVAK